MYDIHNQMEDEYAYDNEQNFNFKNFTEFESHMTQEMMHKEAQLYEENKDSYCVARNSTREANISKQVMYDDMTRTQLRSQYPYVRNQKKSTIANDNNKVSREVPILSIPNNGQTR